MVVMKPLKCKPSAPYASVVSMKEICIVAYMYAYSHALCQLLSCAHPGSARALTAGQGLQKPKLRNHDK